MRSLLFLSGLSAVMAAGTWAATLSGTARDPTGHQIQNALVIVRSAHSGSGVGPDLAPMLLGPTPFPHCPQAISALRYQRPGSRPQRCAISA